MLNGSINGIYYGFCEGFKDDKLNGKLDGILFGSEYGVIMISSVRASFGSSELLKYGKLVGTLDRNSLGDEDILYHVLQLCHVYLSFFLNKEICKHNNSLGKKYIRNIIVKSL